MNVYTPPPLPYCWQPNRRSQTRAFNAPTTEPKQCPSTTT